MINIATNYIIDWFDNFIIKKETDEFLWYDMAVGQRATKIAYLLHKAIITKTKSSTIYKLIILADLHILELMNKNKISEHSNHGLFQMVGLLTLSKTLPFMRNANQATTFSQNQIKKMLNNHFTKNGLHKEHSPDYHIFMTKFVYLLQKSGLMEDDDISDLVKQSIDAIDWMCLPDGKILPFGDTKPISKNKDAICKVLRCAPKFFCPVGMHRRLPISKGLSK